MSPELPPEVGTAGETRSPRRNELTRQAARLFAEKGYHGTSIGDLAEAMGVQKGSLYAHIESKADLLWEVAREGGAAFHAALSCKPDYADAHVNLGDLLVQTGQHAEALGHLRYAVQLEPRDPRAKKLLQQLLRNLRIPAGL